MFRTPLKNSKSVNKPFKSPFAGASPSTPTAAEGQSNNKPFNKNQVKQLAAVNTPTSTRNLEAKRILNLDNEENQTKKRKLLDGNQENKVPENAKKSDLQHLKRKIFELRQELDCLKSREQCTKKHDPEKLKESISRWNTACQTALETLSSELSERNGQSSSIADVLKMLNIPEEVVHYSEKDDAFV